MQDRAPLQATVSVRTPGGEYDILIGHGLIGSASSWQGLPKATQAVIVSNTTVWPLYGAGLAQALQGHFPKVSEVLLPDGEAFKDWQSLNLVFDHLMRVGADRRTLLVALGGGVVGDMTGFAAACFMRGIECVQVPTTLLSQVDSSVGGKTAINHPMGKNMIGAFHQPQRVVCDLATLATLPTREFSAGLAEVIKYGPIADLGFLEWLEANIDGLMAREPALLVQAVRRCCEIKAEVVGQDERESGLRAILNFGHTFGHAIEAGLGYGEWLHGEAVGCGMVLAADLSARLGLVPAEVVGRVSRLVERAGLPLRCPPLGVERYMALMRVDKKALAGEIRFVVLEALGRAGVRPAPDEVVGQVLRAHGAGS